MFGFRTFVTLPRRSEVWGHDNLLLILVQDLVSCEIWTERLRILVRDYSRNLLCLKPPTLGYLIFPKCL